MDNITPRVIDRLTARLQPRRGQPGRFCGESWPAHRKAAGLDKHVHVHMLRHTWASHCIMRGIPSRVVMTWGGWTSEAMLDRYAHLAPREVESMIQRISPPGAPLRVIEAAAQGHHRGTAGGPN